MIWLARRKHGRLDKKITVVTIQKYFVTFKRAVKYSAGYTYTVAECNDMSKVRNGVQLSIERDISNSI